MTATVREIVDSAMKTIGEVAGSGVQEFSDDRMMEDAVRSFNLLFKKRFWEQYIKWYQLTLDGVLGVVTTNAFEKVLDFEDFAAVFRDGESTPLPKKAFKTNPYLLTGNKVMYWTGLNALDANYVMKKLQFYPVTAIGKVVVAAREYPMKQGTPWGWQDTMYLDKDMLALGTAFLTLSQEDLNPAAASICQGLMEMKYKDIISTLGSHPILIEGGGGIPMHWTECR